MKKLSVLLALMLLLAGCTTTDTNTHSEEFFAMDTLMHIAVYDGDEGASSEARQEIVRLEALFSRTRADSDISRLNTAAGTAQPVVVSEQTLEILQQAVGYRPHFDITIAPVMDAWGFTQEERQVPTQAQLDALLPLVAADTLELDLASSTARLPVSGMAVDLGGIAKGWAAQRAISVLKGHGVTCALLDLGGNISALGTKQDGSPWRVAVRDPLDSNELLCVLSLTDRTLSTSGGYERYFESDGVVYHHIIDPATGYPAQSGLISVTAVSPSGGTADANSTALFVMGAEQAIETWRQLPAQEALELVLVTETKHIYITEGLEQGLLFEGEEHGYTYEIVRR